MHEAIVTREIWSYVCAGCQHTWDAEFEEWHVTDNHGGDVVSYHKFGQPCVSPWAEAVCPRCQSYAVKPVSSRTIARGMPRAGMAAGQAAQRAVSEDISTVTPPHDAVQQAP